MKTQLKFSKCLVISIVSILSAYTSDAQFVNMQVHREMGSIHVNETTKVKRDGFRAKFEAIGFDSVGTYYFNSTMQYSTNDKGAGAQLQLFHGIKFTKSAKLQALVGHQSGIGTTSQYYAGIHYPLMSGRVKFLPFIAYVYNKDQKSADFRLTSGISTNLANKKILVFGFVNAFTKDKTNPEDGSTEKEIGFQSNPQVWFRFNKQIAVGTEIGMDYLPSRYQQFIVIPTAAMRWAL